LPHQGACSAHARLPVSGGGTAIAGRSDRGWRLDEALGFQPGVTQGVQDGGQLAVCRALVAFALSAKRRRW
jgi:hypothetical protein